MTHTNIINAPQDGQLVSTDFDRFDLFLDSLGLPKENVLATADDRNIIQINFPQFIQQLPDDIKRESRYLSKFAAASAIGLFDAALNYVWNEVVINLRKKTVIYGLELFFDNAVGGKYREFFSTEDHLSSLKDKVLLDTCSKLELISDTIHKKLTHILIMRNDIGASHPNDSSVNPYELMGFLHTCVHDVINDQPSEAAIQVKAFIDNLKSQITIIDVQTLQHMQNGIRQLHTKNNDNILRTTFGMYAGAAGNNVLKKNISLIAPTVWGHSGEDLKYKLGITLDGYRANLHNEKYDAGNEFFDFCGGNQYKTLEARVIIMSGLLDELSTLHGGHDNFYHEVPTARIILSHINSEADIPNEINQKLILTILKCRIGKGVSYCEGVSPQGRGIYDDILSKFGDFNVINLIITLYNTGIHSMLSNQYCRNHALTVLQNVRKNIVSEKVAQIVDHLISNGGTLEKTMRETSFKTLAASHINFQ